MRFYLSPTLLAAATLSASSPAAFGQAPPSAAPPGGRQTVRQVADGVQLLQEIVPESADGGPLIISVLRVEPGAKGVRVEAALGQDRVWGTDPTQGRETVSKLAARHKAVAGINGGFFPFAGPPIGLHIQGGELVTEANNRATFSLLNDGTARFDLFSYAGTIRTEDGAIFSINGLNRKPGRNDALLLYTPIFFNQTLKDAERFEVVLSGVAAPLVAGRDYEGTVSLLAEGGATALAKDTVVLSGGGGAGKDFLRAHLKPGAKVRLRIEMGVKAAGNGGSKTFDWSRVREAMAGGPRLISEGRVNITAAEEGVGPSFVTTRHPRTAVGTTKDGTLLLVTVDGRQKTLSRGASLPELAAVLLKYGAVEAINLDGGGSTALVVRDALVNSPSEGRERPVANALLVFADVPDAAPKGSLAVSAPQQPLTVGQSFALSLTDAAGTVLTTHPRAVWGATGGVGFVGQDGVFRALRPGKGTLQAALGNAVVSAPVTVIGAAQFTPALSLAPDREKDGRATLVIRIADGAGNPLTAEPVAVTVTGGTPDAATVTTDLRGEARVGITWTAAPDPARQSVSISSPRVRFAVARIAPTNL